MTPRAPAGRLRVRSAGLQLSRGAGTDPAKFQADEGAGDVMDDKSQPLVERSLRFLVPARSIRFLQANLSRGEPGILASYALIGAVIALGGLGFIIDRFADTAPWFLIVGLLAGVGIGFYNLVKTAWRR